ncbi:MAG: (Fe-S)-binding protein [Candidatus Krumholzibacteria bacterium]|nr:(Fe-S)-binding protein [Candidatus Krumholzibacteria bacterium]MDH4337842.1 (Fe-S)-binding protein [Candidatus Krumholzibacteria bacterium]MDH5270609.1 (Fe-S)-binding protein [Candidatus Krumholzibacteria bacterium]
MTPENIIFILVLATAGYLIVSRSMLLISYLRVARADNRTDDIGGRVAQTLVVGFGQSKILRDRVAGPIHAAIFWGFLILLASAAEMILEGLHHGWSLNFLGPIYSLLTALTDVFCVVVMAGCVFALWRRYISKVRRLEVSGETTEAGLILLTIFIIVTALFVQNAARLYATGTDFSHALRPLSGPFGTAVFALAEPGLVKVLFKIAWWTHAVLILGFLNYLPYSKHLHVLTSIPNVFFSPVGPVNHLEKIDFEAEGAESFGVVDIEDLSWKSLLDGYTCTHCGRCTSVCPANTTGKVLDPRAIIMQIRERTMDKAPLVLKKKRGQELTAEEQSVWDRKLIGDYVSPDALWQCTTCGACMQECPVNIEHVPAIVGMRRSMVMMDSSFNEESSFLPAVYGNMETNSVPWGGFSQADRAAWAEGTGVKTAAEDPDMDVLFWVGCAGSYDERARKITRAFAELMQIAGVKFRILGTEENCTGDVARRTGNEYLADMLTKTNVETFQRYSVKRIVATCPHCFNTLRNDYPAYGFTAEVVHHTQFIRELMAEGRLKLDGATPETIAYHDSCYLGRYNDEYASPRGDLSDIPGLSVREPARAGDRGFCCGAGGGRMFMEEKVGDRVNIVRTRELLATGAKTIAANCPFCTTMLTDGVKADEANADVVVKDVAEIVRERLRRDTASS